MVEGASSSGEERDAITAAFDDAAHSLAMEGLHLDRDKFPEIKAVVEGRTTFDEAAKAMATRYTKT